MIPLSENFKVSSKCVLRMCLGKRGTDLEMVTSKCFVQKYTMLPSLYQKIYDSKNRLGNGGGEGVGGLEIVT